MILVAVITFVIGIMIGATALFFMIPGHYKKNIDYKERWESALDILTHENKITRAQFRQLMGIEEVPPEPRELRQYDLERLSSIDRRKIAVKRAELGLPPVDDLDGMFGWDAYRVSRARTAAELRRMQQIEGGTL